MEFNIYELMKQGVSREEIEAMIADAMINTQARYDAEIACAEARVEAERAAALAQASKAEKDALMSEGRAYFINAIIAYTEALEGKTLSEEEVANLEQVAVEMEDMLIKAMQLKKKLEESEGLDLDDLFGMFGI